VKAIKTTDTSKISAEVAAAYTRAMHVAQQLEQSMRFIIFLGDRYALLRGLKLTRREKKKFADTQSFLDSAGTSGRLLTALVDAGLIKHRKHLESALHVRNELAHWFLVEKCSGERSDLNHAMSVWFLEKATRQLSDALRKILSIQATLERQAEERHSDFQKFITSLKIGWTVGEREKYRRKKASPL